jgi:N-acetylmuramoyl-L-alanine amidase
MEIKQKLIPKSNTKTRPGIPMLPKYITCHTTANTSKGANALAHANLQYNGNSRQASWHYTCDQDNIYQSVPDNEVAWHAGDGRGPGNMSSIGIEICVNSDGNFTKAKSNAVQLIRHLMDKHKIPLSNVVPHKKWSGKDCPHEILPYWDDFINQIKSGGDVGMKVKDMYDLSIASGYTLVGKKSSKDTDDIAEAVAQLMVAGANFIVIKKRDADPTVLRDTLNKLLPPE